MRSFRTTAVKRCVDFVGVYRTPYEKLVSLPNWEQQLKPGISAAWLRLQALRMSDTDAAQQMQKAKLALLAKSRAPK